MNQFGDSLSFSFALFGFGLVWFGLVWFGLVWFGLESIGFVRVTHSFTAVATVGTEVGFRARPFRWLFGFHLILLGL